MKRAHAIRTIVVAPDKFKGSLSAAAAAEAMAAGLRRVFPDAEFRLVPVADGGDGTLEALVATLDGQQIEREVTGPDGRPLRAAYGLAGDGTTAVVELARASGLALLPPGTNDPLTATTYGSGELIAAALAAGARRIVLAIGGSATNDAGTGALRALGARFLDARGADLPPGGAALVRLERIDASGLDQTLAGARIEIACDVDNPLVGPHGASAIYGPQKGASPDDVRTLDRALSRFAEVAARTTGVDVRDVPGAGAAGGVGGGFLALAGAQLRPGADLVLDVIDFRRRLEGADLVVTGEGRLDKQTLRGKAPFAVAKAARTRGIPVIAIAGSIALSEDELDAAGIEKAVAIVSETLPEKEAMAHARKLTEDAAFALAGAIKGLN